MRPIERFQGKVRKLGYRLHFRTNTSGRENFWAGIKWVKGEHALTCPSVSLFSFKERHRNTINALFYTQRNKNCGIKDLSIFTYGNYENVWVRGQREKRDCLCIVPLLFPIKNKFEYALKLQIKVLWFLCFVKTRASISSLCSVNLYWSSFHWGRRVESWDFCSRPPLLFELTSHPLPPCTRG